MRGIWRTECRAVPRGLCENQWRASAEVAGYGTDIRLSASESGVGERCSQLRRVCRRPCLVPRGHTRGKGPVHARGDRHRLPGEPPAAASLHRGRDRGPSVVGARPHRGGRRPLRPLRRASAMGNNCGHDRTLSPVRRLQLSVGCRRLRGMNRTRATWVASFPRLDARPRSADVACRTDGCGVRSGEHAGDTDADGGVHRSRRGPRGETTRHDRRQPEREVRTLWRMIGPTTDTTRCRCISA